MSELGYSELQNNIAFLMTCNRQQMELIQAQVTLDQLHTSKICELLKRIEDLEERVTWLEKDEDK